EPVHQRVRRRRRCALSARGRRRCTDRKRAARLRLGRSPLRGASHLRGARPRGPPLALPPAAARGAAVQAALAARRGLTRMFEVRSPEETKAWMEYTLASYEKLALGYLAVVRKADGALIGRCGLMDMVVESAKPEHGMLRGWFGRERAPADVALTSPNGRAREPPARWTWSVSRGIATCGRSPQAARRSHRGG